MVKVVDFNVEKEQKREKYFRFSNLMLDIFGEDGLQIEGKNVIGLDLDRITYFGEGSGCAGIGQVSLNIPERVVGVYNKKYHDQAHNLAVRCEEMTDLDFTLRTHY